MRLSGLVPKAQGKERGRVQNVPRALLILGLVEGLEYLVSED